MLAGCTLTTSKEELALRQVTAQELTILLHHREAAIQSLKGLFSAKVRGGLIPIASRVEGTVYYRQPNALRLRGFTPIGNELFDFRQVFHTLTPHQQMSPTQCHRIAAIAPCVGLPAG